MLMLAACTKVNDPFVGHCIRGTLYHDAELQQPAVGDTLIFREVNCYRPVAASGKYLGWAVTDSHGRWAFSYVRGFDNTYQEMPSAKIPYRIMIIHYGEILYYDTPNTPDTLQLYPGCWTAPWSEDDPQPIPDEPENC